MIGCRAAQTLPRLPAPVEGGSPRYMPGCYDRIICDVPCSGDGTTRKNPSIWHRWTVEYALEMHPLQLQIAMRAAALLKVRARGWARTRADARTGSHGRACRECAVGATCMPMGVR